MKQSKQSRPRSQTETKKQAFSSPHDSSFSHAPELHQWVDFEERIHLEIRKMALTSAKPKKSQIIISTPKNLQLNNLE
ncbi:hypothetical protein pb186bvf_004332 [Paramecium bursaria]